MASSRDFLERNYPTIYLYGNPDSDKDAEPANVRIAFSRERPGRDRPADSEWKCRSVSKHIIARVM